MGGMKDQTAKREAMLKGARDHDTMAVDSSAAIAAKAEKLKRAEESLRTVMYLSCWGPN